jgi:RNA polymerase sigma factor (sigma-70 family)
MKLEPWLCLCGPPGPAGQPDDGGEAALGRQAVLMATRNRPTEDWPSTRTSLLVDIHRLDDDRAWQTFVELYRPLLQRFAMRRGLQDADARDATQNVLLAVSQAIRTFQYDPARGRFRSWLGTIVAHEVERQRRKVLAPGQGQGGSGVFVLQHLEADALAEWTGEFNSHILDQVMRSIRPEFRADAWQAFELVWLDDRPTLEVAEQLDRTLGWVYQSKYRVLRRLREMVLFLASDVSFFSRR